jgi:hypothetical protein
LAETLKRLPEPAGDIDLELYSALEEAEAFAALQEFQTKQAAWLDAGRRIAESVIDPDATARLVAELETGASLADQIGLDDKPVRSLPGEANAFAAEAGLVERTIAFGLRLAEAVGVEKPMTVGKVRKLLTGANLASSLSYELWSLRDRCLFEEAASCILIAA